MVTDERAHAHSDHSADPKVVQYIFDGFELYVPSHFGTISKQRINARIILVESISDFHGSFYSISYFFHHEKDIINISC